MKYRYRFHPYDYALGENEKFYSDMEAQGWRVVKRGAYISKFVPVQPGNVRYRIEVVSPGTMEEDGCTMPAEQRTVYEDCGWEYILGRGLLHLFRAPEGSSAPEFYADPASQLPTIEALRKQNWWGWLPVPLMMVWHTLLPRYRASNIRGFFYPWYRLWVEHPAAVGLYALFWLCILYLSLRQSWYIRRTCRSLRQDIPLDHNPQERHPAHKIILGTMAALAVLCIVLIAVQEFWKSEQPLPEQADGPYLLISDLGRAREALASHSVCHSKTLLGDCWELLDSSNGQEGDWIQQTIYRLHSPGAARRLAAALRATSLYSPLNSNKCRTYSTGGLDAWSYGYQLVAVKGSMAAYIYCGGEQDFEELLAVLDKRWTEYEAIEEGVK